MNELDSVKALETLRAWITHNPRFQGLKVSADEYSDGTLMDEVTSYALTTHPYKHLTYSILTLRSAYDERSGAATGAGGSGLGSGGQEHSDITRYEYSHALHN